MIKGKEEIVLTNTYVASACDESLVEAAKGGEHSAYAELCRRHSRRAFRTVHRITRNHQDAEDAVQDSLMKAFVHLKNFDGRSAFSSWLTRIAINSALMMLRKRRNNRESSLDGAIEASQQRQLAIVETSRNPEDVLLQSERHGQLSLAVSRLSPNLRGVMQIRQSNDASIEEISEALGLSISATKSRLLRGRVALQASMMRMERRSSSLRVTAKH